MGIVRQYKCDGCGAEKREANHWWALGATNGALGLVSLEAYERDLALEECAGEYFILCGQECVVKKVSEFMGAAAPKQAEKP